MLAKEVDEQTVEVMIVVVVGLSKNAKSRVKFPDKLDGPNLVHPKVVHRRADSN